MESVTDYVYTPEWYIRERGTYIRTIRYKEISPIVVEVVEENVSK